jgi:hypothetical protein
LHALILIAATSVAVGAQTPTVAQGADSLRAVITGSVRDSLGIPIEGASVLFSPGNLIARTDSAGRFFGRGIQSGRVTVTVRRLGLSPKDTVVTAHVGVVLNLDLVMQHLPQNLAEVEIREEQNRQCERFSLKRASCAGGSWSRPLHESGGHCRHQSDLPRSRDS